MSITTIIGPMFSGKTSELIRLIDRHRISGKKCIIIKHKIDTRFDDSSLTGQYKIITHSEICYSKCNIIQESSVSDNLAAELLRDGYNVVGVDEGFFFEGISGFCSRLADAGVHVIVSSINTSFQQKLFPNIGNLMGCSENVIQLSAICMRCKRTDAAFTIRTSKSDKEILVGGADMYQAVCRECLIKFRKGTEGCH